MNRILLFGLGAVAIVVTIKTLTRPDTTGARAGNPYKPADLMTAAELQFFATLCRALPDFHIFPQVAMGALLQPRTRDPAAWGRIAQQRVDFVIYDPHRAQTLAIVELDDRSHDRKSDADAKRDRRLVDNGYHVIRWSLRAPPNETEIARAVNPATTA